MSNGIELVAQERVRQLTQEGWSNKHDDEQIHGTLAIAGAVYAIDLVSSYPKLDREWGDYYHDTARHLWPYHDHWFKPTWQQPIKQLTKAGALIVAEIDRLQRIEAGK